MKYNQLGSTNLKVSEVSLGTWAIGNEWGHVDEKDALDAINYAIDKGVNFFDTADIYGAGRSEILLGKVLKERSEEILIATKFGRKDNFADLSNYTYDKVKEYCESSLQRLGKEAIDLYQIHCPSTEVLEDRGVFSVLEDLKKEGKIRYYGVSVETDAQGKFVLENTNASSLQVIVNILRQKPVDEMIKLAHEKNVGILARVPLASGLLSGKYTKDSQFPADDHRNFNREGQSFNVGETFGGLPFEKAIELVNELKWIQEGRHGMADAALKWILQQKGITTVIPGFKSIAQVESNVRASEAKPFTEEELKKISEFYWNNVHDFIRGDY